MMVVTTLAVFFVTLGISGDKTTAATVFAAAVTATVAVVFANEIPGVGKKAVWASYAGEFLFILLPMLWILRG